MLKLGDQLEGELPELYKTKRDCHLFLCKSSSRSMFVSSSVNANYTPTVRHALSESKERSGVLPPHMTHRPLLAY